MSIYAIILVIFLLYLPQLLLLTIYLFGINKKEFHKLFSLRDFILFILIFLIPFVGTCIGGVFLTFMSNLDCKTFYKKNTFAKICLCKGKKLIDYL